MKKFSRRQFSKLTLAGAGLLSVRHSLLAAEKPNSKVNSVHLGINVPYSFGNGLMSAEDILENCVKLGISAVELRTQPVERFLGAPETLTSPRNNVSPGAAAATAEDIAKWRKSVSMERVKEFRKKYEDAGVLIEIVKVDNMARLSDGELDYVFNLAKALGGRAISTEIFKKDDEHKRVGEFADKHQMLVGYHGHATTTPEHWEKAFSFAKFNGANVDLGHFVAGNNTSPAEFIKKHHARVTHVHLKDRKKNNGPNFPFGEGDTPLKEILQLIRDNKWPIQGTIEFEYKVPPGSDRMTEIGRALKYCRDALA